MERPRLKEVAVELENGAQLLVDGGVFVRLHYPILLLERRQQLIERLPQQLLHKGQSWPRERLVLP